MTLDFSTIKTAALWVLIVVAVIAIVLAILIKKIIGKVVTLVIAAVIIFVGWQQRARVVDFADNSANKAKSDYCSHHPSFVGITVTLPGCSS